MLGTLVAGGEPIEDWQTWIPADAVAYSLDSGVRLHPFYERLISLIRDEFPEAEPALDKFEAIQQQIGVHLDRDILQSFSGEVVSVTLPTESATGESSQESFCALRCTNPDKIRDLLHRAVEKLAELPAVQPQQLRWDACEDLEGFEQLHAVSLQMFGATPVVGFHDGWMMMASSTSAVERVLDVRSGKSPTIATSEHFQRFGVEVEGPVVSLSYSNLAENTRHLAQMVRQAGVIAPMVIGMIGAQADPEDMKPIQEIVSLLPSVANVIEKFDFLEEQLTVYQPGDTSTTYTSESVILVRPPSE